MTFTEAEQPSHAALNVYQSSLRSEDVLRLIDLRYQILRKGFKTHAPMTFAEIEQLLGNVPSSLFHILQRLEFTNSNSCSHERV